MCTAKVDGGKRCFSHSHPTAKEAKRRMKAAKESGKETELLEAKKDYFTTEEGIELLDERNPEQADKFRDRRDARIRKYNATTGSQHALTPRRGEKSSKTSTASPSTRKKPTWNKQGIHSKTGTLFNENGWSREKLHEQTGTQFDPEGFDINGLDAEKFKRSGYDARGFDRSGLDERGRDSSGRDINGFHYLTKLNREGYDKDGYDRMGFHQTTGRHYSQDE